MLLKLVGQDSQWDVMLPDTPGLEDGTVYVTLVQITEEKDLRLCSTYAEGPAVSVSRTLSTLPF